MQGILKLRDKVERWTLCRFYMVRTGYDHICSRFNVKVSENSSGENVPI